MIESRMTMLRLTFCGCLLPSGFGGHGSISAQDTSVDPGEIREYARLANEAFQKSEWSKAEEIYRKITLANPNAGPAWYRLGYSLHMQKKYDEAVGAFRSASADPQLKPPALYNWACALALLSKPEQALDKLESAIDAGFEPTQPVAEDSDWASLVEHERFKSIVKRMKQPLSEQKFREFDFWIGDWDVVNDRGVKLGTNKITSREHGMVLVEEWSNMQGQTGMSINYFDSAVRKWKQTWIDGGNVTHYVGDFENGAMRFEGSTSPKKGPAAKLRMTFTPNEDGSIRQYIQQSTDDGKTWTVYFDGKYVKRKSD